MKVKRVSVGEALGHVLVHNQLAADGRKVLAKGRRLAAPDAETLAAIGVDHVYVAVLAPDDVPEDAAAAQLGAALAGHGVEVSRVTAGRADLVASAAGVCKVGAERLLELNRSPGLAVATLRTDEVVERGERVATAKIVPFAVSRDTLGAAVSLAAGGEPVVAVRAFALTAATLLTTGSDTGRAQVADAFGASLEDRLGRYGMRLTRGPHLPEEQEPIARAVREAVAAGAQLVLIGGETSIMDVDDVTPGAIRAAGAEVVQYGVPAEPGSLLLLAYHGEVPVLGLPGCAKSARPNLIDQLLPRIATGERLTRSDLLALGHGGLLR
ncbi:MAG: molybdopterin-binding protein [Deferrisomatales bacterium]|nr:molybdopterin-binding protein [Deferrisomatales bacterium]